MGSFTTGGHFSTGDGKLDSRLEDILRTAAAASPYNVVAVSGVANRSAGTRNHSTGHAVDIQLVDPATGKAVPNYQNGPAFETYEKFAQTARVVQQQKYPDMNDTFRWGGYFGGKPGHYGAADLMHFDDSPWMKGAMAGGSWDKGATRAQLANFPGAQTDGGIADNPQIVSSAVAAINDVAPTSTSAPTDTSALAYASPAGPADYTQFTSPAPAATPAPSAPSPTGDVLDYTHFTAPPTPLGAPTTVTSQQADQAILADAQQALAGSNVHLDRLPPAQAAALVKAIPTLLGMGNNQMAQLNYLRSNGLYDALTTAVPSQPANFVQGLAGVKMVPQDPSTWGLSGSPTQLAQTLSNDVAREQGMRVPNYADQDPNATPLGGVTPQGGNGSAVVPQGGLSWSEPYINALNGIPATGTPQGGGNASAGMSAPAALGNGYTPPPVDSASAANWAQPYTSLAGPTETQMANMAPGADLASLAVAPSVQVPKYLNILKKIQVPMSQPIETGVGTHWDPALGQFVLDAPTKPTMVTKTIHQQILNPAYHPAPPPPPQPVTIAGTNGYNYLRNQNGGYTNVGLTNPSQSPAQAYAQAAARALASQPNGSAGMGSSNPNVHSNGSLV